MGAAFVHYPQAAVPHAATGPLSGLCFAVKDVIDVAGYPTGAGHPTMAGLSGVRAVSAPVVRRLLDAGARFAGKSVSDELAFSLDGNNAHYGAPLNAAAPMRIAGGSSSGSASAVSAGRVDFALGSDTGGSVRVPASHCGLYGLRPTHGLVDTEGMLALAPSFDTCGWLARDAQVLERVADVLLGPRRDAFRPRLLWPADAWALVAPESASAAEAAARKLARALTGAVPIVVEAGASEESARQLRMMLGREAWDVHGAFVGRHGPLQTPDVANNFGWASRVTATQASAARSFRRSFEAGLAELLGCDGVLLMPTTHDIAPLVHAGESVLRDYRRRAVQLLCVASLSGAPQLSLPLVVREGAPMGLSLLGPKRSDRSLVAMAAALA